MSFYFFSPLFEGLHFQKQITATFGLITVVLLKVFAEKLEVSLRLRGKLTYYTDLPLVLMEFSTNSNPFHRNYNFWQFC